MKKNYNYYLKINNKIEKIRAKNNGNQICILRLSFKLDPIKSIKIMKKINYDDKRFRLVKKTELINKLNSGRKIVKLIKTKIVIESINNLV